MTPSSGRRVPEAAVPKRTYAVDRDAAIRSMEAAARAGVRRYVMVSYFGAGPDHGVAEGDSFFPYADAKTAADAELARSDLDWTILRPSSLTADAGTGRIETSLEGATKGSVSRADVALVAAEAAGPGRAGRCHRRVQQRRRTRRRGPGGVRAVSQPPTRKPRPTAAGTADPATYMWDLPGKITARPSGMPSAVRRKSSSE